MAERARKLRLKLKKEKEEQKVEEHKEETSVNVDTKESKQNKGKIIFKKIELSSDDDDDDKDSDDSSCYEPPVRGKNNVVQRSKTPILRKSQKLSKEMHIDNDEIEPLTFLNNLNDNNNNNEYQLPQVDFGFDLDKLISGHINNNEEHSIMNSNLNNSNINQDTSIHEIPSMKVNLMDIMQARNNLKKINNVRNSRKIKSSLKQTNTNKEDEGNIKKLRKLSPSKTKVSKLLIEKGWNKNLNEMINEKVEEVKLLPGFNLNNKINDILNKRKGGGSKYFFENDPDVKVIKGDSNEFKRKVYNVDLVSIMKQTVKS